MVFANLHDLNIGVQGEENGDPHVVDAQKQFSTLHSGFLVLL